MIFVYSSIGPAYCNALRARTNSALPLGSQPSNCVIVVSVTISPSLLIPKSSSLAITPGKPSIRILYPFFGSDRERRRFRSEEHTSELQSLAYLVCRLLLEKKKNVKQQLDITSQPHTYSPART